MKLKDSKILLTGGSLGLGKDAAKVLVESGAQVAITGRREERLQKAADETGAFPIMADVANPADVERTYQVFMETFGRLDCLINNAGIGEFPHLADVTLDQFERIFKVNVYGAALMAKAAVPIFKAQNYGNIINIGSTASLKGFERGSVYAASKFALRGMTQCWQAELRRHNIRVMLVCPSEVPTAFANPDRVERDLEPNKLTPREISHAIKAVLEMDDRGFIPELSVWATNPWG